MNQKNFIVWSRRLSKRNKISMTIHTYIHNWPLQAFSQYYGLASHTIHVVCANFIHEWRDLQFKVDSERQIFEKLFHGRFITLRVFATNLLRGNRRRNIFFFIFRFDIWPWIRIRALSLISQHTTYYYTTAHRRIVLALKDGKFLRSLKSWRRMLQDNIKLCTSNLASKSGYSITFADNKKINMYFTMYNSDQITGQTVL